MIEIILMSARLSWRSPIFLYLCVIEFRVNMGRMILDGPTALPSGLVDMGSGINVNGANPAQIQTL